MTYRNVVKAKELQTQAQVNNDLLSYKALAEDRLAEVIPE